MTFIFNDPSSYLVVLNNGGLETQVYSKYKKIKYYSAADNEHFFSLYCDGGQYKKNVDYINVDLREGQVIANGEPK
ncbi:hypothetical protein LLH06_10130 [Mucilaginibacter daejeonensis]|uniref:hypothetical protein n=1 Tax=Mucilaginibacter daejeonensis TaxID=398049 RepID=UPI001D17803F|nr:hypothetical protein [Mucilaginibacter daejeonensis]UEG55317.1 hypothetical protein LLH06_10130 [Mucilaginibacter daejeonensis]